MPLALQEFFHPDAFHFYSQDKTLLLILAKAEARLSIGGKDIVQYPNTI
jgi:hypothetical protein